MTKTLKRFRVRYTDEFDESCPVFALIYRGDCAYDVEEQFMESDDDGWKIVSIEEIKS